MFDIRKVRADFPILSRKVGDAPLVYLDSAATSQKPKQVLEAINDFYTKHNANIHRGVHTLSAEATAMVDAARGKVAKFINARTEEIIFVRNATEGVKLVAVTAVSNVLGTITPLAEISALMKKKAAAAKLVIDGAQLVPHMKTDVAKLGADFMAFSGHKMLGPTGSGVIWGKKEILEGMKPFLYGGDMIGEVRLTGTTWAGLPSKFEAGTPDIAGIIGLGAAVDYLTNLGMENVR